MADEKKKQDKKAEEKPKQKEERVELEDLDVDGEKVKGGYGTNSDGIISIGGTGIRKPHATLDADGQYTTH